MNYFENFLKKADNSKTIIGIFIALYGIVTIANWKRYNFNPSSMVNFGLEFAEKNKSLMPENAIVITGNKDDLGAGYDGQIFYFYSRTISNLSNDWPKGFDESYRAPRIGYPFLVAFFGIFGKYGNVFGMYFVNLTLFVLSFLALRKILSDENRHLSLLYLISPFSLGSYSVLVSDSVMVSLVIIAYYFYVTEKYLYFSILGGLAIVTKEPALFILFPLGIEALINRNLKKIFWVFSVLLIPVIWQAYLKFTFPNWSPTRLTEFILPLEGITSYFGELAHNVSDFKGVKPLTRSFSRLPLFFLFALGIYTIFSGKIRNGYAFRIGAALTMFMVGTAGYYHFWSVYENISRMFTISIPIFILLKNEDEQAKTDFYFLLVIAILALFILKIIFIQQTQDFTIWTGRP
ncbi:MAG: hypothetical protein K8R21_12880 [Leptospira sp.]|nr:hypothetical protein [Leptospira sp.]